MLCTLLCAVSLTFAQKPKPKKDEVKLSEEDIKMLDKMKDLSDKNEKLKYQTGTINIANGLAVLKLNDKYRFLDGAQTEQVLTEFWGNPPSKAGDMPLGMIVPAEQSVLDPDSWAVILTKEDDGHINDDDAKGIDYNDMLKSMRKGEEKENEERTKLGYKKMTLNGWAEQPHYDEASHKLYWARDYTVEGAGQNTLNYDVRVLGRTGYISMNAIAGISQLAEVREAMKEILPMIEFNEGKRYADYDANVDRTAEYGIAALVAGGVAAKTGLLKTILLVLAKSAKLIVVGVIALGGAVWKLLTGRSDDK